MVLTLAGWIVVSLCNRSNNRNTVLLATKNQARIEISAALKQYLDYLHDIEDPVAAIFGTARSDDLNLGQGPNARQVLAAVGHLENSLKHDPRLGVIGLEILKGYIPLFPKAEEVMVDIQLSQYPIEKDLDRYFDEMKQLIERTLLWGATPTDASCEEIISRLPRTDNEKGKIWSQISIVSNFVEHLNFTVLRDLAKMRERWIWTGNREYFNHLDQVEARLYSDRNDNPHVQRWEKE
jgi:hypothetical protein